MFTYSLTGTPLSLIQINAEVIVGGTNNPDSIYAKTAPPLPGNTTSGVNLNTWNTAFWDISAYFSQALDDGNHNGGTKIITVWGIGPVRITFNEPPGNSSTGGSGGGSNSLSQVFQNAIFGNESVFNHATEYPCRNEWQPQSGGAPSGNSPIMPAVLTAHPKGIGNFVQQWIQLMATGNYSSPTDAMNDIDWDEVGSSDTHEMMDDSPLNTMILQSIASMLNGAKNQGCGYTVAEAWNGIANSPLGDLIELSQSLDLNVTQMTWLGNNALNAINTFVTAHPNDSIALDIVNSVIQYSLNFIMLEELNYLYDNLPGIEEAAIPPINPPISLDNPICTQIFNFKTLINEVTNTNYAAMILHHSYYQFNLPGGGTTVPFEIQDMRIEVHANSNNNACLASCSVFAANAINNAVLQVQQLLNTQPPGPLPANIKSILLVNIHRNMRSQIQNCNRDYTGLISISGGANNWDSVPEVNCDTEIINCQ